MDSYEIEDCVFRVDGHFAEHSLATSGCQSLHRLLESTTTGILARKWETELAQKTRESSEQAAAGLNAQIELLQLLKGAPSPDYPLYIKATLNKTFLGDDIAELRQQYESDRDAFITPVSLPSTTRQTRSQARVAKRLLVETIREDVTKALLDTPVVKKPRHNNTQKLALPQTPAPLSSRRLSHLSGADLLSHHLPLPATPKALSLPTGPRRSSRLTTVSKVNFAEAAFGDAEDFKYNGNGDEAEAVNDGEADDLLGDDTSRLPGLVNNERFVETPFVDERGLTRIGPQPKAPAIQVIKWAPKKLASVNFKYAIRTFLKRVDKKMKTREPEEYDAEGIAIHNKLMESLVLYNGDKVTRVCDYTGVDISFAPGPQSLSLEAIYPFIVVDGKIAYHTAQNVCIISTALNWTKGGNPPIYLPLIAAWINAQDMDIDFEERKGRLSWIFNALTNTHIISHFYYLQNLHSSQVNEWKNWEPAKQKEVLQSMRTGTKTAQLANDIAAYEDSELFYFERKSDTAKFKTDA